MGMLRAVNVECFGPHLKLQRKGVAGFRRTGTVSIVCQREYDGAINGGQDKFESDSLFQHPVWRKHPRSNKR